MKRISRDFFWIFLMASFLTGYAACRTNNTKGQDFKDTGPLQSMRMEAKAIDSLPWISQYFHQNRATIPLSLCTELLDLDNSNDRYIKCESFEKLNTNSLDLYVIMLECTAGGKCEENWLVVFDQGKMKSKLKVGSVMSDVSFKKVMVYKFLANQEIELEVSQEDFDDNRVLVSDTVYYERYQIEENGLINAKSKSSD